MESRTASFALSSAIQAVISDQKEPAPTAPGIRSEPSKRNVASGSVSSSADSSSIGLVRFVVSRALCGGMNWPPLARLLMKSGDVRYSWNACTCGSSENAPTNSPPPRTGRPKSSEIGGR